MLILPIIRENKISYYEIKLKDQEKIEKVKNFNTISTMLSDKDDIIVESEVYSRGRKYTRWFDDKKITGHVLIDNIRTFSSPISDREIEVFVSTKKDPKSNTFDVYKLSLTNVVGQR